jgi:hypothetical protein
MSQNNGFAGGFFLGAFVGSVIGGIVGTTIANRSLNGSKEEEFSFLASKQGLKLDPEEGIELARRRLEDKIAQLNLAIDDVRQQLGNDDELPLQPDSVKENKI